MNMLHLFILLAALSARVLPQATAACRFMNGSAIPTGDEWDKFAPCPNSTIRCALHRSNAPEGNRTLGSTRDECLP